MFSGCIEHRNKKEKMWVQGLDLPCIVAISIGKYVASVNLNALNFKIWDPIVVPQNWKPMQPIRKLCYPVFILNRIKESRDCYEAN